MKSLYFFLAFSLISFGGYAQATAEKTATTASTTVVTVEQAAERMCRCAEEQKLTTIAQKYNNATSDEQKAQFKSELAIAARQMQNCMNMTEIQLSTRNLPREQRVQFEDSVQKKVMENCPEVATALQNFR